MPAFRPAYQLVSDRKFVPEDVGARSGQFDVLVEKLKRVHAEFGRKVIQRGHRDKTRLRVVRRAPRPCGSDVVDHRGPLRAVIGYTISNEIWNGWRSATAGPSRAPAERIPAGEGSIFL